MALVEGWGLIKQQSCVQKMACVGSKALLHGVSRRFTSTVPFPAFLRMTSEPASQHGVTEYILIVSY